MRYAALLLILLPAMVMAQTPGNCERGEAQGDLNADGSEVFARVFNTGSLFFGNATTAGNGYEVPRVPLGGSRRPPSPLFATTFWIGGKVDNELRVAAARYTRYEMWPGPLSDGASLPSPTDCTPYDRIFVVSRADVRQYQQTRIATNDLRDWPVAWGAPVLDGDGEEGNYNLAGGDQPAIYGDQTAWWVMNDVGNIHEETGSNPLGVEVQVSAFAVGSGIRALRQATFYRYVVVNRSANMIDSAYVSLFMDPDLGDAVDDWPASDTTYSMVYVLNGDNDDSIYGTPPAQGYQVVQGPVGLPNGRDDDSDGEVDEDGELLNMTAGTYICSGCTEPATNDMRTKEQYYNHMQGRWKDGTPYTASGYGYNTNGPITVFFMPGDPVTAQCWSATNDCLGGMYIPNDTRLMVHTGPFRLEAGDSTEVVFAMPFGWGSDNLDSVTQLRYAAHATREAWQSGLLDARRVEGELQPVSGFHLRVSPPYPNPFTDRTTIRYELSEAMAARVVVFDVLGREVAVLVDAEQPAGPYEVELNGTNLSPGTYVVRFEAAGEERSFTVVKQR